jgi:hypothetical protein
VLLSDGVTPALDALVVLTRGTKTLQTFAGEDGSFDFPAVTLGSFKVYAQERFGPGSIERGGSLTANGQEVDVGTLVLDDASPRVDELVPATGSEDQPLATVVTVRFSEPLDRTRWSGSWVEFKKLAGGSVGYTASWADGDATLVLTPNAPLASFTTYQVTVKDGYDLAGRRLVEQARTVFSTVDVVPPTVVDVVPRNDQNQVPIDSGVRVTFSERVVFESLSGSAFQLTDLTTGQGVGTTFMHLAGERQVLLTPVGGLQTDRQLKITSSLSNSSQSRGEASPALQQMPICSGACFPFKPSRDRKEFSESYSFGHERW